MTGALAAALLLATALAVGSVVAGSLVVVIRVVRAVERVAELATEVIRARSGRDRRSDRAPEILDLPPSRPRRRVGFDPGGPTRSTERPRAQGGGPASW